MTENDPKTTGPEGTDPNSTDDVWRRDEIESPCVKVCVIHPAAMICIGCHRTRDEIAGWSRMTPAKRREVMDALPAREPLLRAHGRRGGSRRRRDG